MKNQYFGDKRDYFKYSLLEALAGAVPGIEQLTCIWMLTPAVPNNDGRKAFVLQPDHARLAAFFRACQARGIADVTEMRAYFRQQAFRFFSYGENPDRYFNSANRLTYFSGVPDEALHRSLVFFDPDNGLEPAGKATSAHLRYRELADVFQRMDAASIAVIYQHLPRIEGSMFWPSVAARLRQRLATPVAYIAESDVAFFVVPRDRSRLDRALMVLNEQAQAVGPGKRPRRLGRAD
jgi:hypothetical protein